MNDYVAAALARRLKTEQDPASVAGIRAALEVGGFDPDTTEPDDPQGYLERSRSSRAAWNPAYLTTPELEASQEAFEAVCGGPF